MARPRTRRVQQAPAIRTGKTEVDRAIDATRDVVNRMAARHAPSFAGGTFTFRREPGRRADVDVAAVRLFESRKNVERAVELRSPAKLAEAYSLTMPAALPDETSLLQVTTEGELETTRDLDVDSVRTAEGFVRRGQRRRYWSGLACQPNNGSLGANFDYNNTDGSFDQIGNTNACLLPLMLEEGERIVELHSLVNPSADGSMSMALFRTSASGAAATQIGSTILSSGLSVQTLSLTGLAEVVGSALVAYFVQFVLSTVSVGNKVFAITLITDVP